MDRMDRMDEKNNRPCIQDFKNAAIAHGFEIQDTEGKSYFQLVDEKKQGLNDQLNLGTSTLLTGINGYFIATVLSRNNEYSDVFWSMPVNTTDDFVEILIQGREAAKQSIDAMHQTLSEWFNNHQNSIKLPKFCNEALTQLNVRLNAPLRDQIGVYTSGLIHEDELGGRQGVYMQVQLCENVETHQLTVVQVHVAFGERTEMEIQNLDEFLDIIRQIKELYASQDGHRNPELERKIQDYIANQIDEDDPDAPDASDAPDDSNDSDVLDD